MGTTFIYKCPNTGLNVQGFVAEDPAKADGYQPVMRVSQIAGQDFSKSRTGISVIPGQRFR